MRRIEAILNAWSIILLSLCYASYFSPSSAFPSYAVAGLTIGLAVFQLYREQYRWQMLGTYLTLLINVVLLFNDFWMTSGPLSRLIAFIFLFFIQILSGIVCWILPVPVLPPFPKGLLSEVGVTHFHWVDESREAGYGENGPRELMVMAWYPSDAIPPKAKPVPYFKDIHHLAPLLASFFPPLPAFLLTYLRLMKTQAYPHPPVSNAAASFPVLIFSHGYTGIRNQNTILCQRLAAQGYIIFAINHTYDSVATIYSDGRAAGFKASAPAGIKEEALYQLRNKHLHIRTQDVLFVLDCIEKLNLGERPPTKARRPNSYYKLFENRLNLKNGVGLFGHSFGGGTSIQAGFTDPRVRAIVGLDSWLWPVDKEVIEKGLNQSMLLLEAPRFFTEDEPWTKNNRKQAQDLLHATAARIKSEAEEKKSKQMARGVYWMKLKGSKHHDFCDVSYLIPPSLNLLFKMSTGMPRGQVQDIMSESMLNFFNLHLSATDNHLTSRFHTAPLTRAREAKDKGEEIPSPEGTELVLYN